MVLQFDSIKSITGASYVFKFWVVITKYSCLQIFQYKLKYPIVRKRVFRKSKMFIDLDASILQLAPKDLYFPCCLRTLLSSAKLVNPAVSKVCPQKQIMPINIPISERECIQAISNLDGAYRYPSSNSDNIDQSNWPCLSLLTLIYVSQYASDNNKLLPLYL